MKHFKLFFFVFINFVLIFNLMSQDEDMLTIDVNWTQTITVFLISDFDPTGGGNNLDELFEVVFQNYSGEPIEGCIVDFNVFRDGEDDLFWGNSKPFVIENGYTRITNQDLISDNSPYELDDYDINEEAASDLEEAILASGMLPDGAYTFHFLFHTTFGDYDKSLVLNVLNPNMLDLLSPGSTDGNIVSTNSPIFSWISNAQNFEFVLCKQESGQFDSYEIIENEPIYQIETNETVIQYPAAAPSLEDGETYAWQITALVETSGGQSTDLASDIFMFTIESSGESGGSGETNVPGFILNILNQYGPEIVDIIIQNGYTISSPPGYYQNSIPISQEDLQAVFQNVMSGSLEIRNINFQNGE